ncbi:hypothetical protein ILYODFUR_017670 [Ilyodon furcidens]|uniref:Uncharacterized protein n=1 Tax=Ilyodon furcidens TaxID=33524 RepID=A0ABV0U647_9TELE
MPAFPNPVYSLTDRLKAEKDKVAFTLDEACTVLAAGCMKDAGKTMVLAKSFVIEKRVISNLLYFLQLCLQMAKHGAAMACSRATHTHCVLRWSAASTTTYLKASLNRVLKVLLSLAPPQPE